MKNLFSSSLIFLLFFIQMNGQNSSLNLYISPTGNDNHPGTKDAPFLSMERALAELEKVAGRKAVTVWFNEGTYYLKQTMVIDSKLSGNEANPVSFSSLPGTEVSIKGSKLLAKLKWKKYKEGIFVTNIPSGLEFDQLFVNGERQIRARFPNYDYQNPIRGGKGYLHVTGGTNHRYDQWFSYDPETFTDKKWKNPKTGIVHAFQSHNWGNMQYRVEKIDRTENKVILGAGGWQLQRRHGIGGSGQKSSEFFIENIFEELDVAGEWFLDKKSNQLYFYPMTGVKLDEATIEVPVIKDLIQLKGSNKSPVKHIQFNGFQFSQSTTTFMEKFEPVARGDWAIHRGGAIYMEGAENCVIEDCSFEFLGGNGVFMSGYNRDNMVKSCRFVHLGESAVCFVGLPSAVRLYQTWDDVQIEGKDWNEMRKDMDMKAGPKTPDYPKNCVVENCIMHDFGDFGKQVAAIYISMSHKIRSSHNTIYNCPRAGICINDGTWGGHIVEYCDIWETVRETGEHGPFNSWGRERQWKGGRGTEEHFIKEYTRLDAIDNTIIRNNRIANFRKSISAGNWTIDLDDGSSYFEIYNNLNLGSTIKLRDGMARKVYNNITVSAVPLGWHVWPKDSEDEIYQNIFIISGAVPGKSEATQQFIRPIGLPKDSKWSTHYDKNLYWNVNSTDNYFMHGNTTMDEWQKEGYDLNSIVADPLFVDPGNGNFQVHDNSPALTLGFNNIPMDSFGHKMNRMLPFGGEFSEESMVKLIPDERAGCMAKIFYTLDGSEPNINSLEYTKVIKLQYTTLLKARTFDSSGIPIGFTTEAQFTKVKEVKYPSWYTTLIRGEYSVNEGEVLSVAHMEEIHGALLINIADDPDLIDGTGGYNFGCYIQALDPGKAKLWMDAGLEIDWVIQQVNENKVKNIADLQLYLSKYKGQKVRIIAVRDYGSRTFNVEFP